MSTEVKNAYLAELRRLLTALPGEEREAALTYYEEYFDDAGPEEAERVADELGPARALAEQILSGYSRDYLDAAPRSSSAQVPARPEDATEARRREEEARATAEKERAQSRAEAEAKARAATPPRRGPAAVILIILLTVLALPLLIPLAVAAFGLVLGLFLLVLGVGLGLGAAVLAVLVSGVVLLAAGFGMLLAHTLEALIACGIGLALLGLGLVLLLACLFIVVKVAPAVLRFVVSVLRWPFERKVARA